MVSEIDGKLNLTWYQTLILKYFETIRQEIFTPPEEKEHHLKKCHVHKGIDTFSRNLFLVWILPSCLESLR